LIHPWRAALRREIILVLALISFAPLSLTAGTDFETLRAAAEQGDAESQYELAVCFDYGRDVQQDRKVAAAWYRRAADQGHANAQNSLGSLFQAGEGIARDYAEAFNWYQAAADSGLPQAKNNLAYMYDLGLGVTEDDVKAVDLYREAAEGGHVEAMLNIGLMYAYGTGVQKDYETAYMWLDLSRFYTQRSRDMQLKWRIRGILDELASHMTDAQKERAKSRSKAWHKSH
jgi:TPR repeat protein